MTHAIRHALAALALFCAIAAAPGIARAAQDYDNCTGFIDSLPATIGTQGTWCLDKNLSTAITSGAALTIAANNVTLDCNDFKIGGLAAGPGSNARGIRAVERQNVTVRNCQVRGFETGIQLSLGAGYLVEDNRLDGNVWIGISAGGPGTLVRRNAVYDTGGHPGHDHATGISVSGDAIDNIVSGVFSSGADASSRGIIAGSLDNGNEIRGNRIRGLMVAGSGSATGIRVDKPGVRLESNHISAPAMIAGIGIDFTGGGTAGACMGNTVANFTTAFDGCDDSDRNLSL